MFKSTLHSSTKCYYEVTKKTLLPCCPPPEIPLWNAHPRIYLPFPQTDDFICPYCGTKFYLKEKTN